MRALLVLFIGTAIAAVPAPPLVIELSAGVSQIASIQLPADLSPALRTDVFASKQSALTALYCAAFAYTVGQPNAMEANHAIECLQQVKWPATATAMRYLTSVKRHVDEAFWLLQKSVIALDAADTKAMADVSTRAYRMLGATK
jgi:hypothetical protein